MNFLNGRQWQENDVDRNRDKVYDKAYKVWKHLPKPYHHSIKTQPQFVASVALPVIAGR
jgi:hypothetical protein